MLIGQLYAILCTLCWSATAVLFTYAGRRVGSLPVNLIRLVLAVLFFMVLSLVRFGAAWPQDATMHQWIWLSISGFIGFFLGDLFLFRALILIGTRLAMLVMALAPLFSSLIAWLWLNESLAAVNLTGMAVTLTGVVVVVGERRTGNGESEHPHYIRGVTYALLGALGQGLGAVLAKIGMAESFDALPAMLAGSSAPLDAFHATQIRAAVAMVGFLVMISLMKDHRRVISAHRDRRAMGALILAAMLGPFVGASLFNLSLQHIPTGVTQTITATLPVTVMPLTRWMEKDRITIRSFVGAAIAVAGVFLLCQ